MYTERDHMYTESNTERDHINLHLALIHATVRRQLACLSTGWKRLLAGGKFW